MPGQSDEPKLSPELLDAMRRHQAEEHGRRFEPERDLRPGGDAAQFTVARTTPAAGERFWCRDCPGSVFVVGDPPRGDPERSALLRRQHAELRAELQRLTPDEQERYIEAWDRGELSKATLSAAEARKRMATSAAKRPEVVRRVRNAQRFLLDAYPRVGSVERAIDELLGLQRTDPQRYREIMGTSRAYSEETIKGYWRRIALAKRERATGRKPTP